MKKDKTIPRCPNCGEKMKNAIDSITKKLNPYIWKCTCKELKGLRLCKG